MQLPNNVAQMGAPLCPELPAQPNPNPNNKEVKQFETSNMAAYSISHPSCNELHLWLGRLVEPIATKDVPSLMITKSMNQQFENSFSTTIPIIEDDKTRDETPNETHDETSAETLAETCTKTQPTHFLREPPYPKWLALSKAMEQPRFNLLWELKNIYVKIPLLQGLHDVPIYANNVRYFVVKKYE